MVKEAKYSKQYIILAFLINKLIDYQEKKNTYRIFSRQTLF